jgi:hypothetical protein
MKWNILDIVAAKNNHSASDKEAPTTSAVLATSISWTSDDIFSHFFPFTGDSGIRISLPDEGSPLFWLRVFFFFLV